MKLVENTETDTRLCKRWYVKYPLDAYALGPLEFATPVSAEQAVEQAEQQFGEKPAELWPDGPTEETDEYEYTVSIPEE